ncbi:MAG: FAD-dependent oxidoreductase [Desulfobulbus sp.]|jgi:glycerol-3-phosphate dehydrogenase
MTTFPRQPRRAAGQHYDLIIIGGGIYGIALALEASQRGLRNVLLEQKDFGWATSYNHLRTVHGGLRYLQNLDLHRFFESVRERQWFLRHFSGLVSPLPCLMPLYGQGVYRPSVFRAALGLNDLLSWRRNHRVPAGQELPAGKVLDPAAVVGLFPGVDQDGLLGGALWYDAAVPSSQLLVMAMLHQACAAGTTALNYLRAEQVLLEDGQVRGLLCRDEENGEQLTFHGTCLVNAAGPWCRELAATFAADDPDLFRYSLAWNVLFDKPALSAHSLALRPKRPGSPMYFVHGFNGQIMGGTVHSPWPANTTPEPDEEALAAYLADLNLTVPGLHLERKDVLHVYAGLLPAREQGSAKLAVREVIKDHGKQGGPQGAYTVSGVKFTTARLVAEKTLQKIFPTRSVLVQTGADAAGGSDLFSAATGEFPGEWHPDMAESTWQENLRAIIAQQAVVHLDDLILRRTTFGDHPRKALQLAPLLAQLFPWDEQRRQEEIERVQACFPWCRS